MPVDPMIARGVAPIDVSNTLLNIANMRAEQQRTDEMSRRTNLLDRQYQDEAGMEQAKQQALALYDALISGDMGAVEPALAVMNRIAPMDPKAAEMFRSKGPVHIGQSLGRVLGIKEGPEADEGGFGKVNPGDYTPESLARYAQTRDYADLRRQYAPPQPILVNTPAFGAGIVDRRTGQPIQQFTTPEQEAAARAGVAAAESSAKVAAEKRGEAMSDLPRVEANAASMRGALRSLTEAPGLRYIFGAYALAPIVPGTPQADAYAVWEQIQGKAFLEAFNTLKGGGQITEKEGEKATAAITRLANRRQSVESAMNAIRELEEVVATAEKNARRKAGQGVGGMPDPAAHKGRRIRDTETGQVFVSDGNEWVPQ